MDLRMISSKPSELSAAYDNIVASILFSPKTLT